jgi:putative nonproteinogenic amino acid hydroxylase
MTARMSSRILGRIALDRDAVERDLQRLDGRESNDDSPDYVFGAWKSFPLWNGTGSARDTRIQAFDHPGRRTELATELPAIAAIVERSFRLETLKWARLFIMDHGVLLPHRDYLDLDRHLTRLHVPLRTAPGCLHSEQDVVFHMRAGEVWFLDALTVHSACSTADSRRTTLCLDFAENPRFDELFTGGVEAADGVEPCLIERPPLSERELAELVAMAATMTDATFHDTIAALAMVHFQRRVHAGALFEWLAEGAGRSGDPRLLERTRSLRSLAIGAEGHADG